MKKNISEVVKNRLCLFCGSCASFCPTGSIHIDDLDEQCTVTVHHETCHECGKCLLFCPGEDLRFKDLQRELFPEERIDDMVGPFRAFYVGHATDEAVWEHSSSGGLVTGMLLHLLEQHFIDAAVVLGFDRSMPWRVRGSIAASRDEVIGAGQSKYVMYPLNMLLKETSSDQSRRFAYVGLPCQIHSIAKIRAHAPELVRNITHVLGLYCMNNMYYGATKSLFRRFGIKDEHEIAALAYREGTYPGTVTIRRHNGIVHRINKFCFNYLSYFYMVPRCLLCIDQTSELADISVGDGWNIDPDKPEEGNGRSVMIVRSKTGEEAVRSARSCNAISLAPITPEQAVTMHAHVLNFKKKGGPVRIRLFNLCNRKTPDYHGASEKPAGAKRYILEGLLLFVLFVCSRRFSRYCINGIPLSWLDNLMKGIRNQWRRTTQR